MATLAELITRVQSLLSLAGGLGVQTYAQPKIVEFIQMGYTTLCNKRFWNDYTQTAMFTLDGTTGKVTADLTNVIKSFKDIQYIWYEDYANPLSKVPNNRYGSIVRQLGFGNSGIASCPFIIYPVDNVGNVYVRYRTRATTPFTEDQEVPMDEELLVRWAAMMYLTFDNANQAAIQLVTKLYSDHLNDLEKLEENHARSLYSVTNQAVTEWHDA